MNFDDFKMICAMVCYGAVAVMAVLAVLFVFVFLLKFIFDDLW